MLLRKNLTFLSKSSSLKPKIYYHQSSFFTTLNYYQTLGIAQTATQTEIKAAYYKLAKLYHPDVSKGNEEKFKEIYIAYETLSDNHKRQVYNDSLRYKHESYHSSQRTNYQQANSNYNKARTNPFYGASNEEKYWRNTTKHQHYYNRYHQNYSNREYTKYSSESTYSYSDWKNNWNFDDVPKSEEYKQYERDQERYMNERAQEFENALDELREKLLKNMLVFGAAILLTIAFFGKYSITPQNPDEFVLYDTKTNTIYTTDEKTYKEWEKYPNHDSYPFQNDPRFQKKDPKVGKASYLNNRVS